MNKKYLLGIMIFCILLGVTASFLASEYPDGLEWVAGQIGFLTAGEGKEAISSPLPDYVFPGIENRFIAGALAAILGTVITFFIALLLGKLIIKRNRTGE